MSSTIRLIANPDIAFPNIETTVPAVIIVKSLVHNEGAIFLSPINLNYILNYIDVILL